MVVASSGFAPEQESDPTANRPALILRGIDKSFDGRPALIGADFALNWGEVHGLLGENGAGKSTLMTVACGLYRSDAGTLEIDGAPVVLHGPIDASTHGLGMVHQHFKLVRRFTVAENIALTASRALGTTKPAAIASAIRNTADRLGFAIDPAARIADLSIAEMQRVEIIKTLLLGARIIILDEPTAVLTDQESEALLQAIAELAKAGHAVVLISHKLNEVASVADRVTVMRAGKTVAAGLAAAALDRNAIARLMVGDMSLSERRVPGTPGAPRLTIANISGLRDDGTQGVSSVQLSVRAGEIYGLAGVGGNGQSELADILLGLRRATSGQIIVDGVTFSDASPAKRRQAGLRAVPADRYGQAMAPALSVAVNWGISELRAGAFGPAAWVASARMKRAVSQAIADFDVQGATPGTPVRLLSGGNAQKLVLARELGGDPGVIIAHSPTRGLDVRACQQVHQLLRDARDRGAAVILISEDLDEVLTMADTIGVMSRGRIAGELPGGADRSEVGRLMLGHA